MSGSPESRKRSGSPIDADHSIKRQRSVGREESQLDSTSAADMSRRDTDNNSSSATATNAAARLPRIPKVRREGNGSVNDSAPKPALLPNQSAYNDRRGDSNRNQRQRPDDERPRDFDRVRERPRRRSRSPTARVPQAYRRRSPPKQTRRSPSPITRSPSPIRNDAPPNRPRPGGGTGRGRNRLAEQAERDAQGPESSGYGPGGAGHGVQNAVNQWYNAVPEYVKERGRDWRRNESQIKGLRSFNNWVKSCIIQKFSPQEKPAVLQEELGWGETAKEPDEIKPLLILDMGCGKGGDLGKWDKCPQPVGLYVGLDPADQSIAQARDRFKTMWKGRRPRFEARFAVKDCFAEWIGDVPIVGNVGIDPTPQSLNRWGGGGGFDIVTMMFSMHYSFESREKMDMMLRNVAGALKKGGRFIGVCPNSDVLSDRVRSWFTKNPNQYNLENGNGQQSPDAAPLPGPRTPAAAAANAAHANGDASAPSWGNSIYSVRFPPAAANLPPLAADGSFRPPWGHKYTYFIAEAVDVPEFVVPWEAFRANAENYGLEQRYRKPFLDIWHHETDPDKATNTGVGATSANRGGWGEEPVPEAADDATAAVARELEQLGVRMGVIKYPGGPLQMSEEEKEAVSFYHGFCFIKN